MRKVECSGCSLFIGGKCSAPKCPFGKFSK